MRFLVYYVHTGVELVERNNGTNSRWNVTFSTVRSINVALPTL